MKAAVFLDRDDTLIRNVPYLGDPAQVRLLPGVREHLPRLRQAGYELFVVSNQSGVGRGLITKEQVQAVNDEMCRQLGGDFFAGWYLCYAAPEDPYGSEERKPSPAMPLRAAKEHGIELGASFFLGDRLSDVLCGIHAGCRSVLILNKTEDSEEERRKARASAHYVAEDFASAAEFVIAAKTAGETNEPTRR